MTMTFDPIMPHVVNWQRPYKSNEAYPSLTRPLGVLSVHEFAYIQRRDAPRMVQDLLLRCWSSIRRSLMLIRPGYPVADPFDVRPYPDLAPLLPAWDRLCCWYRETLFDRQLDLFGDPWEDELQRWHRFVRYRCSEVILDRPDWTRLILESIGILPILPVDPDKLCEDDPVTGADCFAVIINANTRNNYAF